MWMMVAEKTNIYSQDRVDGNTELDANFYLIEIK